MTSPRPRLLIAEDSPANSRALQMILGADHELLFALDGQQAVDLARTQRPELILMDALMPGLDGFDACARLKASRLTSEIPVIFITALEDEPAEIRALELGAFDFISKPIRPAVVRARIRNCLENKRQRDQLAQLSFTDGLTGVANRRRFDEQLELEWRRACRTRRPLSLALLDVDAFKAFNDALGHPAGDDALRRLAAGVASAIRRPGDLLARYGGEEFGLVLAETDAAGARFVAERILGAVRDLALPHPASPTAGIVTVSIGLATASPAPGTGQASLIKAADQAMYQAKAEGRDRLAVAQA
ncbi:MAG: diguanylate cyclase [Anaeromyxobacter sp.]